MVKKAPRSVRCPGQKIENEMTRLEKNAYQRAWYRAHRGQEIARCAKWNKDNAAKVAKNMRACRARNPEHFLKYAQNYRRTHADNYRVHYHNSGIKRRKAMSIPISPLEWKAIKDMYGNKCFYCHQKPAVLTMDHYLPLSKGGEHAPENIVPACRSCNAKKYNLLPDEFNKRMAA